VKIQPEPSWARVVQARGFDVKQPRWDSFSGALAAAIRRDHEAQRCALPGHHSPGRSLPRVMVSRETVGTRAFSSSVSRQIKRSPAIEACYECHQFRDGDAPLPAETFHVKRCRQGVDGPGTTTKQPGTRFVEGVCPTASILLLIACANTAALFCPAFSSRRGFT
jgi:hypothetical protein